MSITIAYQDIKPEINPMLNPRAAGPEGSLMGIPGTFHCIHTLLPPFHVKLTLVLDTITSKYGFYY